MLRESLPLVSPKLPEVCAILILYPIAKGGDAKIISALNAGATWRANQSITPIPPDVDATFTKFTRHLSLSFGQSLTDGTTPLSKAYYEFWAAHNDALKLKQQLQKEA